MFEPNKRCLRRGVWAGFPYDSAQCKVAAAFFLMVPPGHTGICMCAEWDRITQPFAQAHHGYALGTSSLLQTCPKKALT